MNKAFDHYKNFLADIYSWSLGDKKELFVKNKAWLVSEGITSGSLLDLGAGFGSHAIPAHDLGLNVTAVDFSSELLAELIEENADVHSVQADLVTFLRETSDQYDFIFCLGDTLTHLDSYEELLQLLKRKGRKIYLSWRDYKTIPLTDENRFINVREGMTCTLENLSETKIKVTDALNGKQHSYEKLKITPDDVESFFPGCKIEKQIQNRLVQMKITL